MITFCADCGMAGRPFYIPVGGTWLCHDDRGMSCAKAAYGDLIGLMALADRAGVSLTEMADQLRYGLDG